MDMGRLYYGNTTDAIELPDRMLAHLKVVASTKLRRSESFTVSWVHKDDAAQGRATIWLHCSIPLRFEFDRGDAEQIDRAYLERLAHEASSSAGIVFDLSSETGTRTLAPAPELASTLRRAA
jgi:hypothetical protein